MTLGVRTNPIQERMSRTNGSGGGFLSPRSVGGVSTRVSTVDHLQQRN